MECPLHYAGNIEDRLQISPTANGCYKAGGVEDRVNEDTCRCASASLYDPGQE
jgi:hypothetical protein